MLHITNGDSTAGTLRLTGLPGEVLPWREDLVSGPVPQGLTQEEWLSLRARFLSGAYGDAEEIRADLLLQEDKLRSFQTHDEVVLWFEHCLFCQTMLIYLLNWFSGQDLADTKLTLICVNQFPGKPHFRGLGELNADELASLFDTRRKITDAELTLAAQAWAAYTSASPSALSALTKNDTGALPFLHDALTAHLARFPSVKNGLGLVENTALAVVAGGTKDFFELFNEFWAAEPVYGLGDLQFCAALQRLTSAKEPLLTASTADGPALPVDLKRATFATTDKGEATLYGKADFVESNGIETWLGGVHLTAGSPIWRWDEQQREIVMSDESWRVMGDE
jgi:hypothetical protein